MEEGQEPGTAEWWKIYNDDRDAVLSFFKQRTGTNKRKFGLTLWTKLSPRLQKDKDLALAAVRNSRVDLIDDLPKLFSHDKKILLATFKQRQLRMVPGWNLWQLLSPSLQKDKDVIMEAIKNRRVQLLDHLPKSIRFGKDVVTAAYNQRRHSLRDEGCFGDVQLKNLPVKFRDDADIVMLELFHDPMSLDVASSKLRDDEIVVRHAATNRSEAIQFASTRLRHDLSFILSLVECVGRDGIIGLMKHTSPRLRNDQSIVMAAVRINGEALYYASDDMKSNKEIVIAAVQNFGGSLRYAPKCLQTDFDVGITAVRQNWLAFSHVSEELKNDQLFVLQAVQSCFRALELVDDGWHANPDVVYEALRDTRIATSNKANKECQEFFRRTAQMIPDVSGFVSSPLFSLFPDVMMQGNKRNVGSYTGYKIFFRRLRQIHDQLTVQDDTLIACLFPSKKASKRAKITTRLIDVKNWMTQRHERFWLVQHFSPEKDWDENVQKKVMEFAGYDKMKEQHMGLYKELRKCERVINRLIELKWKIPTEK